MYFLSSFSSSPFAHVLFKRTTLPESASKTLRLTLRGGLPLGSQSKTEQRGVSGSAALSLVSMTVLTRTAQPAFLVSSSTRLRERELATRIL